MSIDVIRVLASLESDAYDEDFAHVGQQLGEVREAVKEMVSVLRTVQMLRQLGGMMPGTHEVVMVAVEAADAALAKAAP